MREAAARLILIADVCLCEYTSHGHCGVLLDGAGRQRRHAELLAQIAVSHAQAGADVVAPSDMMDGRVGAIRGALDDARLRDTAILAYAAKYASAFYGPFRDAADSAPQFGDRRGYQMDPANGREALREVALDVDEGADMVMVKPALPYLDVIRAVRDALRRAAGRLQRERRVRDDQGRRRAGLARRAPRRRAGVSHRRSSRAGADMIITYYAEGRHAGCAERRDRGRSRERLARPQAGPAVIARRRLQSPVRAFAAVGGDAAASSPAARGADIWDVDGNRYLDYVGCPGAR